MQSSVQQKILSCAFPSQGISPEMEDLPFCILQYNSWLSKPEGKSLVWAWAPSFEATVH